MQHDAYLTSFASSHMHGTLSPLDVIVLVLVKKYQQTLNISLGTCPTEFLLLDATAAGVAIVSLCSWLLHTVTCTSVHCYAYGAGELERHVTTGNPEHHGCQKYWAGVLVCNILL